MKRRDSPRFGTRVIHRGQSGDTGEPSRDSVRRKRTFVVGIKGGLATKGKLAVWKRRLEKLKQPIQELEEFLGRRGAYFLKRGNGERAIYSFNEPIISLNRAHIMGEKPTEGYIAHPADAARLEEAEELHFNDYAKITTGQEHYVIPQTVSKSAAANVIADFTSPPMLRAVLVELAVQGLLGKPVPEVVELEGLSCMAFEDYLAATKALEVTRAVTRSQAKATSQEPEVVWEAEPPLPEEEEMDNTPAQTMTTNELPVEVDRTRKRRGQREPIPKPKRQRDPLEEPPKDTNSRSSGSGKEAKGSQRSEPSMLERVTAILQDMPQLMQRQCEDMVLGRIRKELQEAGNRGAGGGEYVMDDNGLLWVAPLGKVPRLAVPQSLVPGIMARAHSTYGHPGTARTTALISRRYCWPTLIRDVRDCVPSCCLLYTSPSPRD